MARRVQIVQALCGLLVALAMHPGSVAADEDPGSHVKLGENKERTSFQATITTNQQGVWIEMSARRFATPANDHPAPSDANRSPSARGLANNARDAPVGSGGPAGTGVSISNVSHSQTQQVQDNNQQGTGESTSKVSRSWYDPVRGYFSETTDGHINSLQPVNIGAAGRGGWFEEGRRQNPDSHPMGVYVDGTFQGIVWLPNRANPDNVHWEASPPPLVADAPSGQADSTDPREVALDALAHLPLPDVHIRMNPALGLVAMPGWFWVEGYDGASLGTSRTVSVPPEVGSEVSVGVVPADDPRRQGSSFSVEVRVWPSRYEWSFGDGATLLTQSLGKRYPAESDVTHAYEFSSLSFPNGFPVRLTIEFAAEFRVDGGPPQGLPPIRRTYEAGYRVQEVQPVLSSR